MRKIALVILLGIVFWGCSANPPQTPQDSARSNAKSLDNSVWVLDKINGKKMRLAIVESSILGESALVFNDGIMSGNTGVNQFKSLYETRGDSLVTNEIMATGMASFHKILAENERDIFSVLNGGAKTYLIDNDTLTIRSENKTLFYKRFDPLAYSSWSLTLLNDKYLDAQGLSAAPFLEFSKDKVTGFLGSEFFSADFKMTQDHLKISNLQKIGNPITDTKESQNLQKEFVKILTNSPLLEFTIPTTLVLSSGKNTLAFSRAFFVQFLNGSKWELEYISGEKLENKKPSLEFKDGLIFGSSGINRFNGKFALSDRKIYIDALISTKMAGTITAMEFESRYLKALEEALYFEIRGHDTLIIFCENDILTFAR